MIVPEAWIEDASDVLREAVEDPVGVSAEHRKELKRLLVQLEATKAGRSRDPRDPDTQLGTLLVHAVDVLYKYHEGEPTLVEEAGQLQDAAAAVEDVHAVASFIVGWWPGLEDGIDWGDPGEASGETHDAYQAATRLLEVTRDA